MKISKYKKGKNNKYSVYLDDGRELSLYEEVILKYDLLLKHEVDDSLFEDIYNANIEYDVYYVALNSLKSRIKSAFELKTILIKKEYPELLVDKAINKLKEQGYLNDQMFARSYISNQIYTTNHGPYRIQDELLKRNIDSNIIEEEILAYNDEIQRDKIKKIIERDIKSNRNRGGVVLKQKILNDLKNEGYDFSLVNEIINNYKFDNNGELAKKEYNKLYKKYASKYSGYELECKIKEKLYQKGLVYEEE